MEMSKINAIRKIIWNIRKVNIVSKAKNFEGLIYRKMILYKEPRLDLKVNI